MDFAQTISQWANDVLVWIGFGTLTGLVARGIMPGRDPGGAVATLLMGIGGTIIGCGSLMFLQGSRVTPISTLGFICATCGAFVLLAFYRILGGKWLKEGDRPAGHSPRRALRRHAHSPVAVYEDVDA